MSNFNSHIKRPTLVVPIIVGESFRYVEKDVDGVSVTVRERFCDDYSKRPELISPSDYQLKDLLAAGVNLSRVNTSGMLNPSDPSVVQEASENIASILLDRLPESFDESNISTVVPSSSNEE